MSRESIPFRWTLRVKFIVTLGTMLSLSLGIIFYWMFLQVKGHTVSQLDRQARTLLQQLIITRAWVADHGGLFVAQSDIVAENPLLPGTKIVDQNGKTYFFRNPAMVTRELSEYAHKAGLYKFRLTSLKLKNPQNAPTSFEKYALELFQKNGFEESKEGVSTISKTGEDLEYQRVVPLQVELSCLECHAVQGYKVGEVRGGLSIVLPMKEAVTAINKSRNSFLLASFLIISLVLGSVYLLLRKLVLQPVNVLENVSKRLIESEYNIKAVVKTGDEFESFARAFNKMTSRLKRGYEGAIKSLVAAMEARDPYTRGHTERVAQYAKAIAKEMGFSEADQEELELGAILHDIGKIGISDSILHKNNAFLENEMTIMESHVKEGVRIIHDADFLLSAIPAILYHHERLDGKGYPGEVSGKDLPLIARIIAVADTYDAMTTDRPYRKAMTQEEALAEIENHIGTQFDPEVVKAFRRIFHSLNG